jgi:hypothetical protein
VKQRVEAGPRRRRSKGPERVRRGDNGSARTPEEEADIKEPGLAQAAAKLAISGAKRTAGARGKVANRDSGDSEAGMEPGVAQAPNSADHLGDHQGVSAGARKERSRKGNKARGRGKARGRTPPPAPVGPRDEATARILSPAEAPREGPGDIFYQGARIAHPLSVPAKERRRYAKVSLDDLGCMALIDPDNLWEIAISPRLFKRLGYPLPFLKPSTMRALATRKSGAEIEVAGYAPEALMLQFYQDDPIEPLTPVIWIRPVILKDLAADMVLTRPFLQGHQVFMPKEYDGLLWRRAKADIKLWGADVVEGRRGTPIDWGYQPSEWVDEALVKEHPHRQGQLNPGTPEEYDP